MSNAFTNFLRTGVAKKLTGGSGKKFANTLDAWSDPNERRVTIDNIKLPSPEKLITKHNYITYIKNTITNKDNIHYGSASPIDPTKKQNIIKKVVDAVPSALGYKKEEEQYKKNIVDSVIEIIVSFLDKVKKQIDSYSNDKTALDDAYGNAEKLYKENKLYFDIAKSLKISKIEDINLLLEENNNFSDTSNKLKESKLDDYKETAIAEMNNAINICVEQLKKCDQTKISEYNNTSAEIQILINEIDGTKVLDDDSTSSLYNNNENSEKRCNNLLRIFSHKLNLLKEQERTIKQKKEYKTNKIFFEKTLPKLYKFYVDKYNKLKKDYQSNSGIFSQFKDSILFRDIIGSKIEFTKKTGFTIKKIDTYKSDKKLPKLYSKYQDSYNFLFGNKNKYTGKYKKLSPDNITVSYSEDIHHKWSKIKTNKKNVEKTFIKYFEYKNTFLEKFNECNNLMNSLQEEINELMKEKNTILMVKYRLPYFGARETQKIITISLKGLKRYGDQVHLHIGYFFAYIYYVCFKLSEKNFTLLNKSLEHDSLQNMKNSFDSNNFGNSLLDFMRNQDKN